MPVVVIAPVVVAVTVVLVVVIATVEWAVEWKGGSSNGKMGGIEVVGVVRSSASSVEQSTSPPKYSIIK